jgi:hypothetical protein
MPPVLYLITHQLVCGVTPTPPATWPPSLRPGKLQSLMAEKQDVQTALDNAMAQAEASKGQLAQAEKQTASLQVRGSMRVLRCSTKLVASAHDSLCFTSALEFL